MVKIDQHVVSHAGILRVVQVDKQRLAVGAIGSVTTLPDFRGRGFARAALNKGAAFVGVWLWAPFAVVICPRDDTRFYRQLGWQVADGPITRDQPGERVTLVHGVAVVLPSQGDALWPSGPIDLCGDP
jgi:aminoglycoside 2'-N-acetyltransferase I